MLLVDDDEGELAIGQEQGGAGPHHDPAVPGGHRLPQLAAGGAGDAGMPLPRGRTEPALHPLQHRLGQGDLRQQDQHLGVGVPGQGRGGGLQIDLGLARAGDPVQQGGLEALPDQGCQHVSGGGLAGIEGMGGVGGGVGDAERQGGGLLHDGQGAVVHQPLHHAGGDPGLPRQLGGGQGLGRGVEDRPAGGGHPLRCLARRHDAADRLGSRVAQAAERHGQGLPRGLAGIAGRPLEEGQGPGGQGRGVQGLDQGLERTVMATRVRHFQHHAADLAGAERCHHLVPRRQGGPAVGHGVVEGLRQRQGQQNLGAQGHPATLGPAGGNAKRLCRVAADQRSSTRRWGSSIWSFTETRKVTASLPSITRWS